MERIASFSVDHRNITRGVYVSRVDGDIVTYDIRMCTPNQGIYLQNAPLHTIEHLFATYARNSSYGPQIIYVGPMGCRTGFYLLVRDGMDRNDVLTLLKETMAFINGFKGPIPGASEPECGNWRDHDLEKARIYASDFLKVLTRWSPAQMDYVQAGGSNAS